MRPRDESSERANRPPHRDSGDRLRLGSVLGFEVDIDYSWFVIFFLVFWSLSQAIFPAEAPDVSRGAHVAMGFVGTVLFFASLLAHELSHALVSRAKSIPIEGITLFIFGGMARTTREPDSPGDEILIAGVGPVSSLVLALLFWGCARLAVVLGAGVATVAVAEYLSVINLALAIFNVLPGFPLDGGRVFRAVVWRATGDRTKATLWATRGGQWLGTFLMVLGGVQALAGAPLAGLWMAFIGWFLRGLARMSFQQHVIRDLLQGHVASDLMSPDPVVVPAGEAVESLVQEHFLRLRFGGYPVVDGDTLVGLVTLEDIKAVPREAWPTTTVGQAMTPLDRCALVRPDTEVPKLLEALTDRRARGRALVVEGGSLVGIVSASDVARWIQRVQWMQSMRARGA